LEPRMATNQLQPGSDSASSSNAGADDEEKLQFLMSDPEASPDLDELGSPLPPLPFASSASASASQPASVSTSFASSSSGGISGRRQFGHSLVIQQQQQPSAIGSAPEATVRRELSRQHSRHSTSAGAAAGSTLSQRAKSACLSAFGLALAGDRRAAVSDKWSQRRLNMMASYTSVRVEKLQHQQQQQQPVAEAAAPARHLSFGSPQLAEHESVGTSGSTAAYSLVNRQLSSPSVRVCHHHSHSHQPVDFSADSVDEANFSSGGVSTDEFHFERPSAVSALLRGTASVIASSSLSWRRQGRYPRPEAGSAGVDAGSSPITARTVEMAQMNNSYDDDSEEPAAASARLYSNASNSGGGKLVRSTGLARMLRNGQQSGGGSQALPTSTVALQRDIDQTLLHRPFFTYWITLVHVLVFFGTLFTFGFAPIGVTVYNTRLAEIITRNMLSAKVCAIDYHNLFIGPRMSDLIRVGAKYSLCMRRYEKLYKNILEQQRRAENLTGCCIHNDGSACYQSSAPGCSPFMSTWVKWTADKPGPEIRISGPVCGQDPRTCQEPRSNGYQTWPDDITRWPNCLLPGASISATDEPNHLNCPISARPCCVGIKGECVLTSQHRCQFLRGTFFPEHHLCSQVNCLSDACGMLGVSDRNHPSQFYRLFTSLFLHAGLITLAITLLHHLLFLRRLEQLAGWHRTALIYIGSGVMGNLVSINFLPYLVDVGPTSAQVGSLAPILIEFGMSWRFVTNRARSVAIFLLAFAVLIGLGLFPWFDNFANLGGLASGCLLSVVLLPYIHRGSTEQSAYRCRLISVCVCSLIWLGTCLLFGAIFYLAPVSSCSWCVYFNCAPKWFESNFREKTFVDYCGNADLNRLEPTRCIERFNTDMGHFRLFITMTAFGADGSSGIFSSVMYLADSAGLSSSVDWLCHSSNVLRTTSAVTMSPAFLLITDRRKVPSLRMRSSTNSHSQALLRENFLPSESMTSAIFRYFFTIRRRLGLTMSFMSHRDALQNVGPGRANVAHLEVAVGHSGEHIRGLPGAIVGYVIEYLQSEASHVEAQVASHQVELSDAVGDVAGLHQHEGRQPFARVLVTVARSIAEESQQGAGQESHFCLAFVANKAVRLELASLLSELAHVNANVGAEHQPQQTELSRKRQLRAFRLHQRLTVKEFLDSSTIHGLWRLQQQQQNEQLEDTDSVTLCEAGQSRLFRLATPTSRIFSDFVHLTGWLLHLALEDSGLELLPGIASRGLQARDLIIQCRLDGVECRPDAFQRFYHGRHGNCFTLAGGDGSGGSNDSGPTVGKGLSLVLYSPGSDQHYRHALEIGRRRPGDGLETLGILVTAHAVGTAPHIDEDAVLAAVGQTTAIGLRELQTALCNTPVRPCQATGEFRTQLGGSRVYRTTLADRLDWRSAEHTLARCGCLPIGQALPDRLLGGDSSRPPRLCVDAFDIARGFGFFEELRRARRRVCNSSSSDGSWDRRPCLARLLLRSPRLRRNWDALRCYQLNESHQNEEPMEDQCESTAYQFQIFTSELPDSEDANATTGRYDARLIFQSLSSALAAAVAQREVTADAAAPHSLPAVTHSVQALGLRPADCAAMVRRAFANESHCALVQEFVSRHMLRVQVYPVSLDVARFAEERSYSAVDLLSHMGGILGLWIGASVVSLCELLELVAFLCAGAVGLSAGRRGLPCLTDQWTEMNDKKIESM
uniref:Rhomboid domain-containing protein n=1 Tax=Macrostomum lignano TaxID=282301 RepID=A0A1I8I4Q3_9PLAT